MLRFALALVLAVGLLAAAQVITGGCVVDTRAAVMPGTNTCGQHLDSHELLLNPGFETGSLPPWVSSNWVVTTTYPHSGTYCACDSGNYPIMQSVDTTPGSEILSVTFWSRQPNAQVMAYDFLYSDGSQGEFILNPTVAWQQYDVTSNLNRSKSLVGFRLWGYSGPGTESTYVDDVSLVKIYHDVAVTAIACPRDTIALDSTYNPVCRVANLGNVAESVQTVMAIQHVGLASYYTDTVYVGVQPGDSANVQFKPFHPDSAVEHRASAWTTLANDSNHVNDTLRQFFWVSGVEAVAEQRPAVGKARPGATLMTAVSLRSLLSSRACSVRDASGRLAVEVRPGVYFVRTAGLVRKVIVSR
ncbi:MAG TPA: hypothetical protein VMH22_13200 [bacterium]|nr:hypothetical protein [bacterium]